MNPVALITGSSRGIGRGIARALARAGQHDLVINFAGNEEAARECRARCLAESGGKVRAEIVQADVSLAEDRARMVEFVQAEFGRLDLLVNNAGVAPINRWGQPDDVGRAVVAVALGHFPYSTGQVFQVDGGFHIHTL